MTVETIHVYEIAMRLKKPFETSFGVIHNRRILLIELETNEGTGWGEVTAGEGPFYSPESTDTAWIILRDFLSPLLLGRHFEDATQVAEAMSSIRGHEMAKAGLENAYWDAQARKDGVSLSQLLGGTREAIACGVSLGIHEETSCLIERIAEALGAGYQRIKLKIKPGKDLEVVAAARKVYPSIRLTVDANSAYTLDDAIILRQLDDFGLDYIEQPLQWNEIYEHALLQRQLQTPICLDECIHNLRDAHAAVELNACKVINIKLGRVSGHSEARRIQQYCMEHEIPAWCGGMLESGIGRAHNIAMSTLPGFVFPGDISASQRYWDEDLIEPEVTVSPQGTIPIIKSPGIGYAVRKDFIERLTVRTEHWRRGAAASIGHASLRADGMSVFPIR